MYGFRSNVAASGLALLTSLLVAGPLRAGADPGTLRLNQVSKMAEVYWEEDRDPNAHRSGAAFAAETGDGTWLEFHLEENGEIVEAGYGWVPEGCVTFGPSSVAIDCNTGFIEGYWHHDFAQPEFCYQCVAHRVHFELQAFGLSIERHGRSVESSAVFARTLNGSWLERAATASSDYWRTTPRLLRGSIEETTSMSVALELR